MKDNKKYEQVYNFIKDYITENGYSPTVREICANCGIKSTATANASSRIRTAVFAAKSISRDYNSLPSSSMQRSFWSVLPIVILSHSGSA